MKSPRGALKVGRHTTMAYTGPTYHRLDCPRLTRSSKARATFACRAAVNRLPCTTCLPEGIEVVPEQHAA